MHGRPGMRLLCMLPLALVVGACHHTTQPAAATVFFSLDAPFCSFVLPVQLSVDGVAVADTFRVNVAPPARTVSRGVATSAGTHTLGALAGPPGLVWPDTTVTLAAGETFTRVLPFYCS